MRARLIDAVVYLVILARARLGRPLFVARAGPLWPGTDAQRTFYNLELADTNVVDHHTEIVSDARVQIVPAPPVTVDALEWP